MAWIYCFNNGGTWFNTWHLSSANANTPRNPAFWVRNDGRLYPCHTSSDGGNGNVYFEAATHISW
jgi:hypothetical protein